MDTVIDIFEKYTAKLWSSDKSPGKLYHYTSAESACSIISKKQFWVSSFECMNDNKEFRCGFEIVKCEVDNFFRKNKLDCKLIENWNKSLKDEKNSPRIRPYIFCFTENKESNLHWENYADKGSGIAIELFKKNDLQNNSIGFFVKVNYDESKLKTEIQGSLEILKKEYQDAGSSCGEDNVDRANLENFLKACLMLIFKFSTSYKENHWDNENEWRFVAFSVSQRSPQSAHGNREFRTRDSNLIDYLIINPLTCGYEITDAQPGCNFPKNSLNSLKLLLTQKKSVFFNRLVLKFLNQSNFFAKFLK